MKRRTFINGSIAAAVTAALPGLTSIRLSPIAAIDAGRMLKDFEAAEAFGARVQASMFVSGKLLSPLEIGDRIRLSLAGVDRACSLVSSECVDGGFKISILEDAELNGQESHRFKDGSL